MSSTQSDNGLTLTMPPQRQRRPSDYFRPFPDVRINNSQPRRCFTVWNMLMLVLGVFFCYIVVSNWIEAFVSGDFRGVGISLFLLLLIGFACWRSRTVVIRNTRERAMRLAHDALGENRPYMGEDEFAGVPEEVRLTYYIFKSEVGEVESATIARIDSSKAISDQIVSELEQGSIEANHIATSDVQCAICLSEYTHSDMLCRLPCPSHHVFHKDCIYLWLEQHRVCPYCKHDLMIDIQANSTGV